MTEHTPEATTLLERYDQLKSTNADLLEALKAIKSEADTRDRTAHESLAIIQITARTAIYQVEKKP